VDLATFLIQLLNALQYGLLLFLVASGLTLIFGIMGIINLAHGSFYMIGAYMAFTLSSLTGSLLAAIVLGVILSVLLGVVLEWALFSRLYKRDHLEQVLLTYGLILIFEELRSLIVGNDVHGVPPEGGERSRGIGRHDRLKTGRDLSGFLPVEREVKANTRLRKCWMELDKRVLVSIVLAGALDDALETLAVLWINEHDDVAALDGLRQQVCERDPFAGLRRAHQQDAAFEVLQRSIDRMLLGFHAVDVWKSDLGVRLRIHGVAEEPEQFR